MASQDIAENQVYVTVFLASLRVVNVRKGVKTFYGVVDSTITVPQLSGAKAEFHVVSTPTQLQRIDASHLDRVVPLERRLLGPSPYRGGGITVEIGLFSIKEADLAGPFLALLDEISRLAGVAWVSNALTFADPLRKGIELLTGSADDSILEVGLSGELPTRTGYFLVMRGTRDAVNVGQLRVDKTTGHVSDEGGNLVSDYPYILLRTETSVERSDWFQIPMLDDAYAGLMAEVRAGRYVRAKEALAAFQRSARTCPDLLAADGERLAKLVADQVRQALPTAKTGAGRGELPSLEAIPLFDEHQAPSN